jgi:hypothetical protein
MAAPLVLKALGEEFGATLSDGATGAASTVLVVGGGRGGDPGHAVIASALDSRAAGGGMPWV